jgi:flagellar motor switch/type III secretory pathway protein FliN
VREPVLERQPDLVGFVTYFELQIERPVYARVGIALSRDPVPEMHPGIGLDDVMDVPIDLCARVDMGHYPTSELGALEPGTVLAVPAGALRGALLLAGRTLGTGECGVYGRYYAMAIDRTPAGRDAPER